GNLNFNGGQVYEGDVLVGGTASTSNLNIPGGSLQENVSLPVNCNELQSQLSSYLSGLMDEDDNGSLVNNYGTYNVNCLGEPITIVTMTTAQVNAAYGININNCGGAETVIINVTG